MDLSNPARGALESCPVRRQFWLGQRRGWWLGNHVSGKRYGMYRVFRLELAPSLMLNVGSDINNDLLFGITCDIKTGLQPFFPFDKHHLPYFV
jgi:hypothetical protein